MTITEPSREAFRLTTMLVHARARAPSSSKPAATIASTIRLNVFVFMKSPLNADDHLPEPARRSPVASPTLVLKINEPGLRGNAPRFVRMPLNSKHLVDPKPDHRSAAHADGLGDVAAQGGALEE